MNKYLILSMLVLHTVIFMHCIKSAQVVAPENINELLSYKIPVTPTIDGVVNGIRDNAKKLAVTPAVADQGNGLLAGYRGTNYPATEYNFYNQNDFTKGQFLIGFNISRQWNS